MGLIFDSTIVEVLLGAALLFWLLYKYMTSDFGYWKNRSIAYEQPSFPFGTDKDLILKRKQIGHFHQLIYTKYRHEKVVGMFELGKPYLVIRDPELIKQVLTKDFNHFVDRGILDPEVLKPNSRHIVHMKGEPWRLMRQRLTPAFTSGKMKMMFHLMEACSNELVKAMEPIAQQGGNVAIKEFIACFTTDVIASCAFGLEANSIKNPDNEFRTNGKKLFDLSSPFVLVKFVIATIFPWMIKKIHLVERLSFPTAEFFGKIIRDTITYREANGVVRNDFVDLLIKMKNNKSLHDEDKIGNTADEKHVENGESGITMDELTAQAILFFVAGFETASSAMSFCLYEISLNPDIQVKMRKEIDAVLTKFNGRLSYEALLDMAYMEAVINETLRRYSALAILSRQCTQDYKLPDSNLVIPKDMKIVIPSYAIHHDPEYYPDPYKFDPERFMDDKIKTKNNYTYMPFGEGPRKCIGIRFAMMQMKSCLSLLLHKYELALTEDTPIPIVLSAKQIITTAESPIILKISNRRG